MIETEVRDWILENLRVWVAVKPIDFIAQGRYDRGVVRAELLRMLEDGTVFLDWEGLLHLPRVSR